jgi:hypothetical protein
LFGLIGTIIFAIFEPLDCVFTLRVKYSSKHEDSMEVQLVELVHALVKTTRDVK